MSTRNRWVLGGLGFFFILSSLLITAKEYYQFSNQPVVFPEGSTIAGIPVGGLDQPAAEARVNNAYHVPLVLSVGDKQIHVDRSALGFTWNPNALVSEASDLILRSGFWQNFVSKKVPTEPVKVPLDAQVDENEIRHYLVTEIEPRYAQPGSSLIPLSGTTNFIPGELTKSLLMDQAISEIKTALLSGSFHAIALEFAENPQKQPDYQILEIFLRRNIAWSGFTGLAEIYIQDLGNKEVTHFAVRNESLVTPDVAFTAASTIKIPIMISVLRRVDEPTPESVVTLFERMVVYSENPPADKLMATYLDEIRGPLIVSEDLEAMGMENTFLGGYFYLGAPLLKLFETPANSRTDIFLDPDLYNQTVPSEAGQLLAAIYECAQGGGGLLKQTFPTEITTPECQLMIDTLAANQIGLLIEAGLPDDITVAHKHGWVQELDGQLRSMSDVAIVFTPGGDYVLTIFLYDSTRLDFDQGNRLVARLSQTVYNFFNLDQQAYWWID